MAGTLGAARCGANSEMTAAPSTCAHAAPHRDEQMPCQSRLPAVLGWQASLRA